jgi:hypothetical protein
MRLALTVVLALATGCESGDPACTYNCPDERALVCGTDGRTYDNACRAACARVDVDYAGSCTDPEDQNHT